MNALEKAQLRIQPEDKIPKKLLPGKRYLMAWSNKKYEKTEYILISTRGDKAVVLSPKDKRIVVNLDDFRVSEKQAIRNAKERIKNTVNIRRKLNF